VRSAILAMALIAAPGLAQEGGAADRSDPRIRIVRPEAGQRVPLTAYPGLPLTILLQRGEEIRQVAIGEATAFDAVVSPKGDAVTVEALQPGARSSLNVRSDRAIYFFDLMTGHGAEASHIVRIEEAAQPQPFASGNPDIDTLAYTYRLKGDRNIRPLTVADDGERTYVEWAKDQPLSAVFGIGATGEEEVVNGYMRGSLYVIDRVYPELVFRMDKDKAEAERQARGAGE
jgi:type IV secretion system protein VirB9